MKGIQLVDSGGDVEYVKLSALKVFFSNFVSLISNIFFIYVSTFMPHPLYVSDAATVLNLFKYILTEKQRFPVTIAFFIYQFVHGYTAVRFF